VSGSKGSRSSSEPIEPFEPLVTDRLIIRAPTMDDADALVARRNHPDVAFYQTWPLPYPAERGREILRGAIEQGGPADEQPWMATVALGPTDQPIGDLYIGLSFNGRAAEIGYTFDADHWGHGYAAEAVDALLNHLFEDRGVLRVSAKLHPDNVASAQLLERAGFLWEGQTKLSFWNDDRPEPEHSDDGMYGLTKADRDAWLTRPTGPPDDVRLIEVTHENQRQVRELQTHKSQERFVSPVRNSFADALFPEPYNGHPVVPRMWAIEADGDLAGFVMIAEATEHDPNPYLWRLLIDRRYQRRGIGGRAVEQVEQYSRDGGATAIEVSWAEGRGTPEPFYLARGYVPTGEIEDDEVVARKQL
jgi:RimJ/RimL family protein N-acetyltransferase